MGYASIAIGLGLGGGKSATSSGSPNAVPIFNVTTRNTGANILASSPSNPSNQVNIAFGTDTYDFYIYKTDGTWLIFNNDS